MRMLISVVKTSSLDSSLELNFLGGIYHLVFLTSEDVEVQEVKHLFSDELSRIVTICDITTHGVDSLVGMIVSDLYKEFSLRVSWEFLIEPWYDLGDWEVAQFLFDNILKLQDSEEHDE